MPQSARVAARLRFSVDEGLRDAAQDPRVHDAITMKVSREGAGGDVNVTDDIIGWCLTIPFSDCIMLAVKFCLLSEQSNTTLSRARERFEI